MAQLAAQVTCNDKVGGSSPLAGSIFFHWGEFMSYRRKQEEKHRLKKLYNETKNSYGAGVWYSEEKHRYIRYTCHDEWTKTYGRRLVRRRLKNKDCPFGCYYKRFYDYWWEIL